MKVNSSYPGSLIPQYLDKLVPIIWVDVERVIISTRSGWSWGQGMEEVNLRTDCSGVLVILLASSSLTLLQFFNLELSSPTCSDLASVVFLERVLTTAHTFDKLGRISDQ